MERLRMVNGERVCPSTPCCRCGATQGCWDRIVGKAYCPNCQEALVVGEAPPLVERTTRGRCAICNQAGSVQYLTFPMQVSAAVEIPLCPEHLRALLGRRLAPHAFHQLRRKLRTVALSPEDVFLLHQAFYDVSGRALQPAVEQY